MARVFMTGLPSALLSTLLSGCQEGGGVGGAGSAFDGTYRGVRELMSGPCAGDAPTRMVIRVRDGSYRARDGGMAFVVGQDGSLSSRGNYMARGQIEDGHMTVTLQGIDSRGCLYRFDLRRAGA